jgi:hypothetical protein
VPRDVGDNHAPRLGIIEGAAQRHMQAAFDDRSPQDFHAPVLERGGRNLEGIKRRHRSLIHPSGEADGSPWSASTLPDRPD